MKYPDANEKTWPVKAKLSQGEVNVGVNLGDIISDGERGYICTVCGKFITKAHHIKPAKYKFIYQNQAFYLERHVCNDCMKAHEFKAAPTFDTHDNLPTDKVAVLFRKKTPIHAVRMDTPFRVKTLEGMVEGKAGDWLAKGVNGELYPIANDVFEKTYERMEE